MKLGSLQSSLALDRVDGLLASCRGGSRLPHGPSSSHIAAEFQSDVCVYSSGSRRFAGRAVRSVLSIVRWLHPIGGKPKLLDACMMVYTEREVRTVAARNYIFDGIWNWHQQKIHLDFAANANAPQGDFLQCRFKHVCLFCS